MEKHILSLSFFPVFLTVLLICKRAREKKGINNQGKVFFQAHFTHSIIPILVLNLRKKKISQHSLYDDSKSKLLRKQWGEKSQRKITILIKIQEHQK